MELKHIILCTVIVVFCIAFIVIWSIRQKKKLSESILETEENADFIDRFETKKAKELEAKPWAMKYGTYKIIVVFCAVIFAVIGYFIGGPFWMVLLGACGLIIPEIIIYLQGAKQQTAYEERYATGLRQLVAGLKSGLSIQQAVADVCSSPFVHDSIKEEFRMIDADLKLGIPIGDAFERFAEQVHFQDAEDVSIAIKMQERIGGREAETIESIAQNISNRLMLRKEIKSMFAGSNATVMAMDVIPFGVVLLIYFLAPSYLEPFFASTAMLIVFIGLLISMGIGSIVIHKSVNSIRKSNTL